ncbi:MAG: 50S ribosomal protein L11 methyltransferase [Opitutaceae bacterium]|jgi:ribosomal protein L11 methyltransferase
MNLWEIKIEIAPESVEAADNTQLELGVGGWSVLEDVIVGRAWVLGIFASAGEADVQWKVLEPLLSEAGVRLSGEPVVRALGDRDWKESYKFHFKAWRFGRLHWVPEWERDSYSVPAGDVVLLLDPGLAFGTGNHETTRLCCERLVSHASAMGTSVADLRVIDAGCGSGILALSAALLGFEQIEGFDNDAEAVRISMENAALNALDGKVNFFVGDLVSGLMGKQADILMANILADVLMRFSSELLAAVAPGGLLILSGILSLEGGRVRDAFMAQAPGWAVDSRTMGEWCDVILIRPR